ncbi:MAG: 3-phosphoserine/phosphohydroxythreonine transaminase, partial [Candidatus Aminicenantes bacterium]|nr:3-phosphoserine/phosphohydroxythreonine transaminase [Candidatus Aminicenantes bacterium]
NFYAGPAILPKDVLEKAKSELTDLNGIGLSVMEISHRSKDFDAIITTAEENFKKLLNIPDNYHVLFLQGGASQQFGMIPMNLLNGGTADYVNTGAWAKKAIKEGKLFGTVNIAASSEDKNFSYIPKKFDFSAESKYVHITSNETIGGVQFNKFPDTGNVPLIGDMSSDIMSKKLDISKFGMIYAGAQKNIGPSGVTLVIIRDDLVQNSADGITTMLSYKTHADKKSLYNTPPSFGIYLIKLVTDWLIDLGGIEAIEKINENKANLLYNKIDSGNFYNGTANREDRSKMNITFRLKSEELEKKFIEEATAAGLIGLKGHRSVGGCRASIYNALPLESVQELVKFMDEFEKNN